MDDAREAAFPNSVRPPHAERDDQYIPTLAYAKPQRASSDLKVIGTVPGPAPVTFRLELTPTITRRPTVQNGAKRLLSTSDQTTLVAVAALLS